MVNVCAIASGSNGNCYYIGNEEEAILVDAGISCKQVLLRLEERKLDSSKLKAIFLTHEHADHIRGVRVLSKKLGIPAFYTYGTWNKAHKSSLTANHKYIQIDQAIQFGSFKVHAFKKNHDANEPCSYRIEVEGKSIGVMTDIGSVCESVITHFEQCHTVFLESNYDEKMLWDGSYPWYLKNRVASDYGHLSNKQAVELVRDYANGKLQNIILSHLSAENNTPELAFQSFADFHNKYRVVNTSRHAPSELVVL